MLLYRTQSCFKSMFTSFAAGQQSQISVEMSITGIFPLPCQHNASHFWKYHKYWKVSSHSIVFVLSSCNQTQSLWLEIDSAICHTEIFTITRSETSLSEVFLNTSILPLIGWLLLQKLNHQVQRKLLGEQLTGVFISFIQCVYFSCRLLLLWY